MTMFNPFEHSAHPVTFQYEWGPWKRKFAWTKITIDNKSIRFKFYYTRTGVRTSQLGHQASVLATAVDLFDVLKKT